MPIIRMDFDVPREPTGKMIDLVQDICRLLNRKKPEYTFEAYGDFIGRNKEDYYSIKNELDALEEDEE